MKNLKVRRITLGRYSFNNYQMVQLIATRLSKMFRKDSFVTSTDGGRVILQLETKGDVNHSANVRDWTNYFAGKLRPFFPRRRDRR